jgi:probable rRNA maturation factor
MSPESFSITNKTKSTLPRVPFGEIKETALGKNYVLSLVFIGERRSRTLNRSYRDKDKSTNILSFTLDKNEGEIFITLQKAKREAKQFERKFDNFIAFLFIHGLMHLKGMEHGSTMEKAEMKLRKQFHI